MQGQMFGPPRVELIVRPHMIKKAQDNSRKYNVFHPSAWGSCLRKIAYQYYNESEKFHTKEPCDVDIKTERIYDNGHGIHHRWQSYLDGAGVLRGNWKCCNPSCDKVYGLDNQIGIFNPSKTAGWSCVCGNSTKFAYEEILIKSDPVYNFEGHCDAVIDLRNTPNASNGDLDLLVIDFKSIKDEYFVDLDHAKYEHIIQTQIYMWVLGLHGAVVVYENKNSQALKEIFVPRDDEMIEKIKDDSLWMTDLLEKRKLPARPEGFTPSKFPCRSCEFAKLCYK